MCGYFMVLLWLLCKNGYFVVTLWLLFGFVYSVVVTLWLLYGYFVYGICVVCFGSGDFVVTLWLLYSGR